MVLASAGLSPPSLLEPNSDILPKFPETRFLCFAWIPWDLAMLLKSLFPHFLKKKKKKSQHMLHYLNDLCLRLKMERVFLK